MASKWDDFGKKRNKVIDFMDYSPNDSISNIALAQSIYCEINMYGLIAGTTEAKHVILAFHDFLKSIGKI